jgi:hypothetical protein
MGFRLEKAAACSVLAIAGLVIGCGPLSGPVTAPPDHGNAPLPVEAPLQTDRLVYQLQRDSGGHVRVEIPFTYHNTTGETVYLVNCRGAVPPSLEKWQAGQWVVAWTPVLLMCLSHPIVIESDVVYSDTLRVSAARQGSNEYPQFEVPDLEGTYRLVWPMPVHEYDFDNPPSGRPLPLESRISNNFELRAP